MDERSSQRRRALRWSILAAAGIIPIACSGDRVGTTPGAGGNAGGEAPGGAGEAARGGADGLAGSGEQLAGSGGSAGVPAHTCTEPSLDPVSGLVSCAEGYEHRPMAVACELTGGGAPNQGLGGGAAEGGSAGLPRVNGDVSCFHDEEACSAYDLGYCEEDTGGGGNPAVCHSGCVTDQDCGDGFICLCSGPSPTGGKCHRSDCQTDADCDPGFLCASYGVACGYRGFACQRAADECTKDDDCGFEYCSFNGERRYCEGVACGRPFLVEQRLRLAASTTTGSWLEGTAVLLERVSSAERARLAAHWTRLGLLEHASIAAFARFNLQLLALAAPPELIEACTRALADETAHTRLCFELASAYAGEPIGPGPLDVTGSLQATSLADIVELVIVEGCFGETRAALEAYEAAEAATDPVIRDAYARIAADEERHAALAFRFLRWALERDPRTVAPRLAEAVQSAPADAAAREIVLPAIRALSVSSSGTSARHAALRGGSGYGDASRSAG